MSQTETEQRSAIVFGARNLGRAIIETLVADGWAVAGVARSQSTLEGVREAGALPLAADIIEPGSVQSALEEVSAANGGLDLAVNAASPYGAGSHRTVRRRADRGGRAWCVRRLGCRGARRIFLSVRHRAVRARARTTGDAGPGHGGSARRAMPGRGARAAGCFGVRALTSAAALELRPRGIHVALLIVDAGIEPISGPSRQGVSPDALADPYQIAHAVRFLAEQGSRAATHELVLTPLAESWTP